MWLPEGAMAYPEQLIDGISIRTVSPLALYHTRAVVGQVFGGFKAKDEQAQSELHQKFLPGVPLADLSPLLDRA